MEPIGHKSFYHNEGLDEGLELPLYPLEPDIRSVEHGVLIFKFNTLFDEKMRLSRHYDNRASTKRYVQCVPDISTLAGHEHEFITDPPVTQVMVDRVWEPRCQAILRIREGVRIGDLVDCITKWAKEDDAYLGGSVWCAIAKESGEHTTETDDDIEARYYAQWEANNEDD